MSAQLLDGKGLAAKIEEEIRLRAERFSASAGRKATLAAVLVGEDPASQVYVRNKERACQRAGLGSILHRLPATTSQAELLALVEQLNTSAEVDGILVQLPLPPAIDATSILDAVHPLKDVDCFHPENVGLLAQGRPRFLPCTPHGVQQILARNGLSVAGKHVVVVGRSEIVGKPLALLLMQRDSHLGEGAANATVTVCHSRTPNLSEVTRSADVLIAAIGKARMITGDMVRPGAIVVDVGINRVGNELTGDCDFASVREVASHLTPVPGGIGPLTIVMLLENTLRAAEARAGARAQLAG